MTEPARWALVQWDDGTLSLTEVSLLDKAEDDDHLASGHHPQ